MVVAVPAKWHLPLRQVNIRRNLLNNPRTTVHEAYLSLHPDEQFLMERRLDYELSFDEIAVELTGKEQALWIPNEHPLWGPDSPSVISPEEAENQYFQVIAKLKSQSIIEKELVEMFREKRK